MVGWKIAPSPRPYRQASDQRGHRRPGPPDVGLAPAVTALELSDVFLVNAGEHHDALTVVLLLTAALPVVVWRRWPFMALQTTAAATIALAALHAAHIGLGPIAATYAVACWSGRPARLVAAGLLMVGVWLVPLLTSDAAAVPSNAALFGAAWILGALMRERRLTTAALMRIETVGQESLSELRRLLRRVRPEQEPLSRAPQPGLGRLDDLVAEVRAAGVEVSLAREGTVCPVPASVDLSAYRIVQEALTNAMRALNRFGFGRCGVSRRDRRFALEHVKRPQLARGPNRAFLAVLRVTGGEIRARGPGPEVLL